MNTSEFKKLFYNKPLFLIIYALFCMVLFLSIYYWMRYSVSPEQARLLAQVKDLAKAPIKSIVVEQYELSNKSFRTEISKSPEIKDVQSFLMNADTKPVVGSHVWPIYKCTLTFVLNDGKNVKCLGEVFSDKQSDLYLYNNFSKLLDHGTYVAGAMKPVYVGGFGSWLINKAPKGNI